MTAFLLGRETTKVRAITPGDLRSITRLGETAWRMHLRVPFTELGAKIKVLPGFLAEDRVGLRGFILVEPQRPEAALIIAAGLRDTWSVGPYLDLLLPVAEQAVLSDNLPALAHIGNVTWLVDELQLRGFKVKEWVVAYERYGLEPPPAAPTPAWVRPAHSSDMIAIKALDELAFSHIWRKSAGNFNEAMGRADTFAIAEMSGQIVGYQWYERYDRHAHLTRLAVHPDFQGQGIGAQLLHRAITDALASGVNLITLNTQENNTRSRMLYERFGFVFNQQRMPVLWKELG